MNSNKTDLGKLMSFIFSAIVQLSKEVLKSAIYSIKGPFFHFCTLSTIRTETGKFNDLT